MRLTNILATLALAASVSAWKIPQNTQDGVYTVDTLEDGTEVHTKIASAADIDRSIPESALDTSPAPKSELETRGAHRIWCGCGFDMNRGDCDAAVADLKRQTDGSAVRPNQAKYSIRGSVVAFACNRGSGDWRLLPYAVTNALSAVTGSCGLYIAGAQQLRDDNEALLIGYQRWGGNDDFCGSARSSPANHC